MEVEQESLAVISKPINVGSVALARAMTKALRAMEEVPAEVAGVVSEYVAAARLGVSVDVLRKDRKTGKLGIPFIKIGEGKRGLVRYDIADLDRWVETKKRGRVQAQAAAPQPAAHVEPVQLEQPTATDVVESPAPHRRSPPRTMWEALAETALAEPEDDPFAIVGRAAPRRQGSGYWGH